jgi:hypothetical protein
MTARRDRSACAPVPGPDPLTCRVALSSRSKLALFCRAVPFTIHNTPAESVRCRRLERPSFKPSRVIYAKNATTVEMSHNRGNAPDRGAARWCLFLDSCAWFSPDRRLPTILSTSGWALDAGGLDAQRRTPLGRGAGKSEANSSAVLVVMSGVGTIVPAPAPSTNETRSWRRKRPRKRQRPMSRRMPFRVRATSQQ